MKHYFLFGEEVTEIYRQHGIDKLLDEVRTKMLIWNIYYFDDGENEVDGLLGAYTGWNDFVRITEDEYDKLRLQLIKR